jgi:outer membrane protein TolC
MRRPLMLLLFATCVGLSPIASQEAAPTLTLAQCMAQALAEGSDSRILARNLDLARAQYKLSLAQASFSLSGSLGESATDGFGNAALLSENSLGAGFAQSPQAGLSLASPMTSLSLNSNPYIGASPLAEAFPAFSSLFPPGPTGTVGLGFSQVLWNGYPGGLARAGTRKGLLALQSQELSGMAGRSNIVSALSQAYFAMLASQDDLVAKKEVRAQQDSLLVQITSSFAIGLANEVDRRSAEINARSAAIEERNAENALRTARSRLAQLLGRGRDFSFMVAEEEDPMIPVASAEEAIAEALRRRVELKQVDLSRQSAAIDRALILGQRTPSISVNGGVNLIYQWQGSATAGQGSLGAKVSIPVLDSGAAAHQLEANGIQDEELALQAEQLRTKISTDVEEAFDLVQIQLQRLETAKLSSERSELRLRLRQTELSFGTAKNQDLLDAAVEYANAKSALSAARRSAHMAVLQLRDLMGY